MVDEKIALFDMDGTLLDYVKAMNRSLEELRSPDEEDIDPFLVGNNPRYHYLWRRMDLIKSDQNWWATLPRFQLGFDVYEMTEQIGYHNEILTQAPKKNPASLAGKMESILAHFGEEFDFTITRNKSRHYGRVLIDDFPGYITPWLKFRKNGIVIMPANKYNEDFSHPKVIRYNGVNKEEVHAALVKAYERD